MAIVDVVSCSTCNAQSSKERETTTLQQVSPLILVVQVLNLETYCQDLNLDLTFK